MHIHRLSGLSLAILVLGCLSIHQPPSPLEHCTADQIEAAVLPPYAPSSTGDFVNLEDGHFAVAGERFTVRGVNYFPAHYPWRRFLTATDPETIRDEFALLRDAGFNTLRIFLWYDALFACPGSGAVPRVENFARLDRVLHEAATYDLRLIVTLNDGPDLTNYPLYNSPSYAGLQTALIVSRYRDEPAILAWDLRNEGDIDYGSRDGLVGQKFSRGQVLRWLAEESARVRRLDAHHLITAGWLFDSVTTAPYVDFLSFHYWWDAPQARQHVAEMRAASDKPILMEEFGFSTFNVTPEKQAQNIADLIDMADDTDLLGWLVWTAFDFPMEDTCWPQPCTDVENQEHRFGMWHSDYNPKPAARIAQQKNRAASATPDGS